MSQDPNEWRIVTHRACCGAVIPKGIRNNDGFVCFFAAPTHWPGQDTRHAEECAALQKHAEIMLGALTQRDPIPHGAIRYLVGFCSLQGGNVAECAKEVREWLEKTP